MPSPSMSLEEYRAEVGRPRRKGAYRSNAVKAVCAQGHPHASKSEAKRCDHLYKRFRAGEISEPEQQPRFSPIILNGEPLVIRSHKINRATQVRYTADFAYFDYGRQCRVIEDSKGFDRPRDSLLRAIVEHAYKVRVELV